MKELCLGVAREKITPEVGGQLYGYRPDIFSESVADDLSATAFYFQQGETKALMISAEVCLIHTELSKKILSLLEETFGISKEHCMVCATHTHSGPNTAGEIGWGEIDQKYCDEIFLPALLSVTEKAIRNVRPVKMGVSRGKSLVGINRRELGGNNELLLGQNPWGCYNPEMTVLAFADPEGKPVANMIHYGCHGTAAGPNHEITRDWSGGMIDALEKHSGAITAFFNGPEGDVGPRISNGKTVGDLSYVHELAEVAARDAVGIFNGISEYKDGVLAVSHRKLEIPLKERMPLAEAEQLLEEYREKSVNLAGMMKFHFEEVVKSYREGYQEVPATEVEQTVISLGEIVFAAFPYELFSEIGMRINGQVPSKSVLSLSNTNGSEGYYITRDAICRGGYEVDMFLYGHLQQFHDDADFYLMKESVKHIRELLREDA